MSDRHQGENQGDQGENQGDQGENQGEKRAKAGERQVKQGEQRSKLTEGRGGVCRRGVLVPHNIDPALTLVICPAMPPLSKPYLP